MYKIFFKKKKQWAKRAISKTIYKSYKNFITSQVLRMGKKNYIELLKLGKKSLRI